MTKLKIVTGDIVEISLPNQNDNTPPYVSVVENFDNNNILLAHAPISTGDYIRLPIGEKYSLRIIGKNNLYRVNASVHNYISENNVLIIEFLLLGEAERIQQRDFFRLPCTIPLDFFVIKENKHEKVLSEKIFSGIIRDLSGGGMKVVSNLEMEEKDLIKFNLNLESIYYELMGRIMYKGFTQNSDQFMYGIMFLGLSKEQQEKIALYLHNLQLKIRHLEAK